MAPWLFQIFKVGGLWEIVATFLKKILYFWNIIAQTSGFSEQTSTNVAQTNDFIKILKFDSGVAGEMLSSPPAKKAYISEIKIAQTLEFSTQTSISNAQMKAPGFI